MDISSLSSLQPTPRAAPSPAEKNPADVETREAFQSFVGEVFFGQMLKAMRQTVGKPAYFHGGQAEEIFRGQLDQVLSEEMTQASAASFSDPMFELFNLRRS